MEYIIPAIQGGMAGAGFRLSSMRPQRGAQTNRATLFFKGFAKEQMSTIERDFRSV